MIPVEGKKTKTLFPCNSVPIKAVMPDIVVAARPSGVDDAVGIAHSWNVFVEGSKCAMLLVKDSTNQQHFPDGSNAILTGPEFAVGIAHSVSVAVVDGA
jgi:hypothetical protein